MWSEPPQLAQRSMRQHADYQVMRGAMAYKVPHLSHADAASLDALAFALGGERVHYCGSACEMKKIACILSIVVIGILGSWTHVALFHFDRNSLSLLRAPSMRIADVAHQGLPTEVLEKARQQAMSN